MHTLKIQFKICFLNIIIKWICFMITNTERDHIDYSVCTFEKKKKTKKNRWAMQRMKKKKKQKMTKKREKEKWKIATNFFQCFKMCFVLCCVFEQEPKWLSTCLIGIKEMFDWNPFTCRISNFSNVSFALYQFYIHSVRIIVHLKSCTEWACRFVAQEEANRGKDKDRNTADKIRETESEIDWDCPCVYVAQIIIYKY